MSIIKNFMEKVMGAKEPPQTDETYIVENTEKGTGASELDDRAVYALKRFRIDTKEPVRTDYTDQEVEEALLELMHGNQLDDKKVKRMANCISLRYFFDPEAMPAKIDIRAVKDAFLANEDYMSMISDSHLAHILELIRIKECIDQAEPDLRPYICCDMLSDSFAEYQLTHPDSKRLTCVWEDYMLFTAKYADRLPESLRTFIDENSYRRISKMLKKARYEERCGKPSAEDLERVSVLTIEVSDYILKHIDGMDICAILLKGDAYNALGFYDKTKEVYGEAVKCGSYSIMTALVETYESEIQNCFDLRRQSASKKLDRWCHNRIKALNEQLAGLYREGSDTMRARLRTTDSEDKEKLLAAQADYLKWQTKYARYEKNRRHYSKCKGILDNLPESFPEYYRALTELGLLYQFKGKTNMMNPYHDLNLAAETLEKADDWIREHNNIEPKEPISVKGVKSALMPLGYTYKMLGEYNKAISVCERVLALDSRENRAKDLIQLCAKYKDSAELMKKSA